MSIAQQASKRPRNPECLFFDSIQYGRRKSSRRGHKRDPGGPRPPGAQHQGAGRVVRSNTKVWMQILDYIFISFGRLISIHLVCHLYSLFPVYFRSYILSIEFNINIMKLTECCCIEMSNTFDFVATL
jgi:hypothetical protein